MNPLLMLYMTFWRGPQIMKEREEERQAAQRAQEEADRKNGVKPRKQTCKKCDALLKKDNTPPQLPAHVRGPLCRKCLVLDLADEKAAQAQLQQDMRITPFMWFQVAGILVALVVFIHRNVVALF